MAVLYKANETDFNHLGLGPLNDAVSILVTEERNGMFELEMTYPIEGSRFVDLKLDRLIKADAGYNLKNQRFKIIRITKPIDGIVTVNAEHVSYLTQDLALKPTVNYSGSASQALNTWNNNIVDDSPFIVASDITTVGSGSWSIKEVKNAREALGGVSGSILETYGGEYRFDNYSIRLMAQRGVNSGALIAYGRNLVDLTQEESIADTFTSVYPYAVYQDGDNKEVLLTLPEYFVDSEYVGSYARRKILPVDFSSDEIKDVATLRSRANTYIKSNGVGIPKVNMKIKYVDLAKTLDYKDLAMFEEVNLCDNAFVYFEQLDVNTSAKIIKTVWDDLLEQYDSIEVGEAKSSLSNSINATVDGKLETIVQRVNTIQLTADGLNVIHRGPEEPPPGNVGDLWYEPDGIYENMYQWDGSIWKKMLSTRDLGVLKQEVESVIAQAETDRTEAVQKINQALIDSKVYADEVTTVSALRTKVLASDVITSDMIQSNVSVVDKLFATDANVNRLTSKSAFINSVKAIDISADRVTAGTLNAANVNIINLNVSNLVGDTSNFVKSAWNNATGGGTTIDGSGIRTVASDGSKTIIQNGAVLAYQPNGAGIGNIGYSGNQTSPFYTITTSWGSNFRIRSHMGDGSYRHPFEIFPGSNETYLNTAQTRVGGELFINGITTFRNTLHLDNNNISGAQYISGAILETGSIGSILNDGNRIALKGISGVSLGAGNQNRNGGGFTRVLWLDSTYIYANKNLSMEGNSITNQSDERLKCDIKPTELNSLNAIKSWEIVGFNWKDPEKPQERQLGVVAQNTPDLAIYDKKRDKWSINSSKQIMMNSHAIQQLAIQVDSIENIANASNILACQALSETVQLKLKVEELERKIQQLESAA